MIARDGGGGGGSGVLHTTLTNKKNSLVNSSSGCNSEIDGVVSSILLEALSLKRVAIGFVFGDGLS